MPNSVPPSFNGFAFIGSLAIMTQFSFRSKALRRRVRFKRKFSFLRRNFFLKCQATVIKAGFVLLPHGCQSPYHPA
jgi:hypothetical protein